MIHANKYPRNEKFRTRLIGDDESNYVETDFTIGELEDTLERLTNSAILLQDPLALRVVSLFAFATKQFEDNLKEHSIMKSRFKLFKARFKAFRESVQEIQQLPSKDVKESLGSFLEIDEEVSEFLSGIDGLL